ncbi:phenoloxidase 2-like [Lucilia sericata]|uniref:phenoloxidase 2-like n=1 Tax=Lucilia sericata TaxID=13632 RepID=UPI0018A83F73|nr:phenoloxidase 2-like [Lucilia sericata]
MSKTTNRKALELLFDRPLEPVFTARDDGKAVFDLPESYYNEQYVDVKDEIQSRFSEDVDVKIPLRELKPKPDLSFTRPLGKRKQFSLFNSIHRSIAARLIDIFMSSPNEDIFIATCAYCKDRVNPFLFQYCFSVAVQHRKDTSDFPVKPIAETFPQNFIEPAVFKDARAEGEVVPNPGDRRHIEIPRNYTASDREEEQRLGYFREDIGVNSHHWHWHLVYPGNGPIDIVKKDRRGELFYYMHHQILARYNVERFCNGLKKVKILNNVREPITEGYFPKIMSSLNNRTYPSRNTNTKLQDIDREDSKLEIADLERWTDRIVTAIDQGFVVDTQGKQIPLDSKKGIDILGDMVECTILSVNPTFYGNLHNEGHNAISFCHDPDARFLEDFGVMGDVTTAMRDPVFYRWHGFIDTIFNRHKERLDPYSSKDLEFNGVIVTKLEVRIQSLKATPNTLITYMERSDVNLAAGLDFGPKGNIYATFTHLQHAPFEYVIDVTNNDKKPLKGTCRIFLCPKSDERGTALGLNDQRQLAIEMDKFTVNLMPGPNNIRQLSKKSSITIPYERTFRPIGPDYQPTDMERLAEFRFCGCGWPEHMLLPRGKPEGMTFDLFVMISDFTGDAVQQMNNNPDICGDSSSFCGLKDKLYPDNRTMGYPFDRRLQVGTLKELTNTFSNMSMTDVVIRFNDVIVDRKN